MELANMISVPMSLNAAVRLGIADAIWNGGANSPLTAAEILPRLLLPSDTSIGGDPENLQRMLTSYGVFSEHLVESTERKYSLTDVGKTLITDSGGLISYAAYVLQLQTLQQFFFANSLSRSLFSLPRTQSFSLCNKSSPSPLEDDEDDDYNNCRPHLLDLRLAEDLKWWLLKLERHIKMSFVWNVLLCVTAVVVIVISKWWYRWSNPKCNGKLPPGSMGFPIIGETLEFFKPYGFYEISPFIKKRMLRYGPLFRTNIFGSNTVVTTEPDVIYEIFRQENKSFTFHSPDSFMKAMGKDNSLVERGNIHKHIKQTTLQFLGSEGLKRKMIGDMDQATREVLKLKASQGSFNAQETVESLIVAQLTPKIISNLTAETQGKLIDSLEAFNLDWFQSFFKISTWRSLYKAYVARTTALQVINDVYLIRKESKENHGDFLSTILEDNLFTAESAMQHMFALPVIAKDTTSRAIALAVKFIAENPKVSSELKREHEAILQNRDDKESGVSWEEYKHKMTFTNMVINESLRLANLVPILFRKAVDDVEIKGYKIPAGWIVAVAPSVVHYNPEIYESPLEFNPWRWEGKEVPNGSKTFMVFGGGVRACAGAEFARLQFAIFLHYLITNYNFSMTQDCEVTRTPLIFLSNGVHTNISHSQSK